MALIPRAFRPATTIRRIAMYKAMRGSRGWLAVLVFLMTKNTLRNTFGKQVEVVAIERLTKGQFVRIESQRPPTRKERKQRKILRPAK